MLAQTFPSRGQASLCPLIVAFQAAVFWVLEPSKYLVRFYVRTPMPCLLPYKLQMLLLLEHFLQLPSSGFLLYSTVPVPLCPSSNYRCVCPPPFFPHHRVPSTVRSRNWEWTGKQREMDLILLIITMSKYTSKISQCVLMAQNAFRRLVDFHPSPMSWYCGDSHNRTGNWDHVSQKEE